MGYCWEFDVDRDEDDQPVEECPEGLKQCGGCAHHTKEDIEGEE